jgi:hypothetical protein
VVRYVCTSVERVCCCHFQGKIDRIRILRLTALFKCRLGRHVADLQLNGRIFTVGKVGVYKEAMKLLLLIENLMFISEP